MLASAQLVKPGAVTCSSHLWPFLGVWGCLGGSALHALGPSVPGGRQGPGAARGSPSCTHFLSKGEWQCPWASVAGAGGAVRHSPSGSRPLVFPPNKGVPRPVVLCGGLSWVLWEVEQHSWPGAPRA